MCSKIDQRYTDGKENSYAITRRRAQDTHHGKDEPDNKDQNETDHQHHTADRIAHFV